MTLSNTGAIVAFLNRNDAAHQRCVACLPRLREPLVTTQACLTEALYLLKREAGGAGLSALWRMIASGSLEIWEQNARHTERARSFMERYADIPCDYADATLLTLAEETGLRQIYTIDAHFYAYRLTDGQALIPIP